MSHKHNTQQSQSNQTKGASMSTASIPAEAQEVKKTNTLDETPASPEAKKEEENKEGIFKVVMDLPKKAYDNVIEPAWEFTKGSALRLKDKVIEMYNTEKALMESLGVGRYLLDRAGKLCIGLLKIAATVTFAYLISTYVMTTFGVSIFAPTTLAILLGLGLVAVVANSVMSQKKAGAEVSVKVVGSDIIDAFAA
jgi:hypothetical protein